MTRVALIFLMMSVSVSAHAAKVAWGHNSSGAEFCYPADDNGRVLSGALPVNDYYCGVSYRFGRASDNYSYCFPARNDGNILRGRQPASSVHLCAKGYKWGRTDSQSPDRVACFPTDADGKIPPRIDAVPSSYCLNVN